MQTALRFKQNGKFYNLVVMTHPTEDGKVYGELSTADDEFVPTGIPKRLEIDMPEADYHRGLRVDAAKANQLVRQYSTDPDLNPGKIINIKENENQKRSDS